MSDPQAARQTLANLIAGYERHLVDPEVSAEHERLVKESEAADERRRRRERLEELDVELPFAVHQKVVADEGLLKTTSLEAVRRWLGRRDLPPMLVICGSHGCGKTVSCAWAAAGTPDSVAWVLARDLERHFLVEYGPEMKHQKRVKRARLTILDDIGTEKQPARMTSTLLEILENRKQRKTLVTTNLTKENFLERYSDVRLHSRFRESAIFVYDKGPDLRGQP